MISSHARSRRTAGSVLAALLLTAVLASCVDAPDVVVTGPSTPSASVAPDAPGLQDLGPAIRAAERHTARLLENPAIVGVGVGLDDQGRPTVRLYLVHEQANGIPDQLDGVPVSTVVTGLIVPRQDRTARARPAPIGFSVGHPNVTAGTLGARVKDALGNVYILSNNHVIANSNDASVGDPTLQPGSFDGGSVPDDVIGTLFDFEPISFTSDNEMDAAIAIVDPNDVSGSAPDGAAYGAPSTETVEAVLEMSVQKYGRTTGHTVGTVAEVNVTVSVCYVTRGPFLCAQAATFVNQISITPGDFSAGGDSGSLVVTESGNNPVGLLFAGSPARTIANPIGPVLERFNVTIDPTVPDGTEPPPPEVGTLTGTVTDADTGDGIGGATVAIAATGQSTTTGSNGSYTIVNVPAGTHDVTASASGYASQTQPATINDGQTTILNFSLAPDATEPPDGTVSVASIDYATSGGPQQDRHLHTTITLRDSAGNPVAGASVSATLENTTTGANWNVSGTTGSNGTFNFSLNNAPAGCYTTTINNVVASGLTWDGDTPENEHCK